MIVCPACGSSRVRHDYRPAPWFLRIFLIRALLCDHCNRQFRAFAWRVPEMRMPRHVKRKADTFIPSAPAVGPAMGKDLLKVRTRASASKVSPHPESAAVSNTAGAATITGLREQITRRYEEAGETIEPVKTEEPHFPSRSGLTCPECGSGNVKRRPRSSIERALLSFTEHKAYACRDCQASFYFKADEPDEPASMAKSGGAARA